MTSPRVRYRGELRDAVLEYISSRTGERVQLADVRRAFEDKYSDAELQSGFRQLIQGNRWPIRTLVPGRIWLIGDPRIPMPGDEATLPINREAIPQNTPPIIDVHLPEEPKPASTEHPEIGARVDQTASHPEAHPKRNVEDLHTPHRASNNNAVYEELGRTADGSTILRRHDGHLFRGHLEEF